MGNAAEKYDVHRYLGFAIVLLVTRNKRKGVTRGRKDEKACITGRYM